MCLPDSDELKRAVRMGEIMDTVLGDPWPKTWSEPPVKRCACGNEYQYGGMCESCKEMQREAWAANP